MATTRALRSKVTIALGFLQFDVKLHSAVEEPDGATTVCVGADETHVHQLTPTKAPLACPQCDNGDRSTFKRAMGIGGDEYVVLPDDIDPWTEDELKELKNIKLEVHSAAEVEANTLPGDKFYWTSPQTTMANKPYAMLVNRVLARTDVAFVFEYAIRGIPALYRLDVLNDALIINQLARPELIKAAPEVDLTIPFTSAEIKMANGAIEALLSPFKPEAHNDKRAAAIAAYVATQTGVVAAGVAAPAATAQVAPVDMMAALQASIDAAEAAKAPAPKKRAPRKSAAAIKDTGVVKPRRQRISA